MENSVPFCCTEAAGCNTQSRDRVNAGLSIKPIYLASIAV